MKLWNSCCNDAEQRTSQCEDELIRRVRARRSGWEAALSALLGLHREALGRRCLYLLGNPYDAEDALQETLLRGARGIDRYEGRARLRTWLFSIADNQCYTLMQRRQREAISEHVRELIRIYEESQRARMKVGGTEVRAVRETLAILSPQAREVLALRYFGEASLEEIANTMGIGLSAAKMRLYRAMEQFAAQYPGHSTA